MLIYVAPLVLVRNIS